MKGRICIPIHNEQGELVAYAGRWPADEGRAGGRRPLQAAFEIPKDPRAVQSAPDRRSEHVVLVEGYWSVFRLHSLGAPVAARWAARSRLSRSRSCAIVGRHVRDPAARRRRCWPAARGSGCCPTCRGHVLRLAPRLPEGRSRYARSAGAARSPQSVTTSSSRASRPSGRLFCCQFVAARRPFTKLVLNCSPKSVPDLSARCPQEADACIADRFGTAEEAQRPTPRALRRTR